MQGLIHFFKGYNAFQSKLCEKHHNGTLETTSSYVYSRLCKSIFRTVMGSLGRLQWSFSFWNPNCLVAELTLDPNGGFESLCQSGWFLFLSVRGDVSPGTTRLLLQLALIVLCTSRKAAVNTDHNAVRIHTQGEGGQDRCGALSQDMLYSWKRDQDYYEHI